MEHSWEDALLIRTSHLEEKRTHEDRRHGDRRAAHRAVRDRRHGERRGHTLRVGILTTALVIAGIGHSAHRLATGALPGLARPETHKPPTIPDLAIELNDSIRSAIATFQSQGPGFSNSLARGGRYLPLIREIFSAQGIPIDLAYVALVESNFKPDALSWAKARGVWQFMPATGKRFQLRQDQWVDERKDPEKATWAAAQYLKTLFRIFGDWDLALAAYNAGEGRVLRAIREHGTSNFWELAESGALAPETRDYVPRIYAAIVMARDPENYGLIVEPDSELSTDTVPVTREVELTRIARCIGTDVKELVALNPELERSRTPARRLFELKVPEDTPTDSLDTCLAKTEPRPRTRKHTTRRAE